jgi:hypothetical protein
LTGVFTLQFNPKFHMEAQKTTNGWGNTENKEKWWRYHNIRFQTILHSHSNKSSMTLAQKLTQRSLV